VGTGTPTIATKIRIIELRPRAILILLALFGEKKHMYDDYTTEAAMYQAAFGRSGVEQDILRQSPLGQGVWRARLPRRSAPCNDDRREHAIIL
jgi:hypothetical protein